MHRYEEQTSYLVGFIYVHRISDIRVGGTSKRNLKMFQRICGTDSFKNVTVVTTMWDKVTSEEGEGREQELKQSDVLFKPLMDGGATMARHDGTREPALKIMQWFSDKNDTVVAKIVDELVKEKKNILDTEAGKELQSDLRNVLQKHQKNLQALEDEIREAKQQGDKNVEEEAAVDRRKVLEDIAKVKWEFEKLRNTSSKKFRCVSSFVLCNWF